MMKFALTVSVAAVVLLHQVVLAENPCAKPPVSKRPNECCGMPPLVDKAIQMDCYERYIDQTRKEFMMDGIPRGCCIAECALNATGLYAGNGMINRDEMTMMFMEAVKDMPQWQQIVRDSLDECFMVAESKKDEIEAGAKLEPAFEGEVVCNGVSGTVMRCMGMRMYVKCPAQDYTSSDECNQLQEFSKNCPVI